MTETDELIYSRYLAEHSDDDFRILPERRRESLICIFGGIPGDAFDTSLDRHPLCIG